VQSIGHRLPEQMDVALLNVSSIFAQMDGDAIGAAQQREHRRGHRIGLDATPRLTQRSYVIDVDAQSNHPKTPDRFSACGLAGVAEGVTLSRKRKTITMNYGACS